MHHGSIRATTVVCNGIFEVKVAVVIFIWCERQCAISIHADHAIVKFNWLSCTDRLTIDLSNR